MARTRSRRLGREPGAPSRRERRGHGLADPLAVAIEPLIARYRDAGLAVTTDLYPEARHEVLSEAIAPHPWRGRALRGRTAIVVDDVMTTGATLAACATAALDAGAAGVRVLVLARAFRGDG